jgi:hypothetical protein
VNRSPAPPDSRPPEPSPRAERSRQADPGSRAGVYPRHRARFSYAPADAAAGRERIRRRSEEWAVGRFIRPFRNDGDGVHLRLGRHQAGWRRGVTVIPDKRPSLNCRREALDGPITLRLPARRLLQREEQAIERRERLYGTAERSLRDAWNASTNPAELVSLFALHPAVLHAPAGETPRTNDLLPAALEAVRRLAPPGGCDASRDERRVRTWIERGWTVSDVAEIVKDDPLSSEPHAIAATRLVWAFVDLFNASEDWHADENRTSVASAVEQIASPIQLLSTNSERRGQCAADPGGRVQTFKKRSFGGDVVSGARDRLDFAQRPTRQQRGT